MTGVELLIFCCVGLLIILLISSIRIVPQQEAFVIERLGKYNRTLYAGINFIIPIIEYVKARMSLYIQNLDFEIVAISIDKVNVKLYATLLYQVKVNKVAAAFYSLANPIAVMQSTIENSVRSYVAKQTHEEIIQKRDELTDYLLDHLSNKFDEWGYVIVSLQIKDVVLPLEINEAMSKVVASRRLKEAAEYEAEANKILQVKKAEADMEARKLAGIGIAEERKAIVNGLMESLKNLNQELSREGGVEGVGSVDRVSAIVMFNQYVDMLQTVASSDNAKVVFLNADASSFNSLLQQIYSLMQSDKQ